MSRKYRNKEGTTRCSSCHLDYPDSQIICCECGKEVCWRCYIEDNHEAHQSPVNVEKMAKEIGDD